MPTPHIAALLRERDHYLRRGRSDRAAQVTAELERLGYVEESDPAPETTMLDALPETVVPPRPRPRRSLP